MNLNFHDDYDFFYFTSEDNLGIQIKFPINAEELVLYFQASLHQNKFVIISNQKKLNLNLEILRAKHFHIQEGESIFLNFSIKKKISQLKNSNIIFNNYQDVEAFLQEKLSTIF